WRRHSQEQAGGPVALLRRFMARPKPCSRRQYFGAKQLLCIGESEAAIRSGIIPPRSQLQRAPPPAGTRVALSREQYRSGALSTCNGPVELRQRLAVRFELHLDSILDLGLRNETRRVRGQIGH